MKNHIKNMFAVLTSGILLCSMTTIPTKASDFDVVVSIDTISVSKSELTSSGYEVPVFVRMTQNVDLNAIEFGVSVDTRCQFDIVTRSSYAAIYGETLDLQMSTTTGLSSENFCWATWSSLTSYYYEENSNLLMLLVTVPETAQPGDVYTITYLSESPGGTSHVWYNFETNTNYVTNGNIAFYNGSITIVEDTTGEYIAGDVNLDGTVNIMDVILLNRVILNKELLNATQEKAADVDGDGKPTSEDALMIMKMIVGLYAVNIS